MYAEYMLPLISTALVVYTILVFLFFIRRYLQEYRNNKRLIFTRDSIKEIRTQINVTLYEKQYNGQDWVYPEKDIEYVMSLYNELAVGINEGLYDELYVKVILGKQMINFYNRNIGCITVDDYDSDDSQYMPLEFLLKRWDSKDAPKYRMKKGRFY